MSEVGVHLRGGIGDVAILMTKFRAIREKHSQDRIVVYLNAPYPSYVLQLLSTWNPFDHTVVLDRYCRELHPVYKKWILEKSRHFYDLNLWNGSGLRRVERVHPELPVDWWPCLNGFGKKEKNPEEIWIVVMVKGKSAEKIWSLKKWEQLVTKLSARLPRVRIFLVGENSEGLRSEALIDCSGSEDLKETMGRIASADLFIGIDSGLRNIGYLLKTPTVTFWGRQPTSFAQSIDVWLPREYRFQRRNKVVHLRDSSEKVFGVVKDLLGGKRPCKMSEFVS